MISVSSGSGNPAAVFAYAHVFMCARHAVWVALKKSSGAQLHILIIKNGAAFLCFLPSRRFTAQVGNACRHTSCEQCASIFAIAAGQSPAEAAALFLPE